jgi:serine/threonine protein kinase
MNLLGELRILGLLTQDVAVQQLAAQDRSGLPVLLTVGKSPLHEGEPQAFLAWAGRLADCSSHPHLGEMVTYGVADGRAYLAVRTGTRRTLAELLAADQPPHPEQVRMLGAALAGALAAAHEANVLHLAIRPDVIFVDEDERPLLVGFDAAAPGLTRPMATGPLSAPEYRARRGVLDGHGPHVGGPADVYSLAALLYTLLGGQLPWAADDSLREVPLQDLPGVRPELVDILRRALAVHPAHRPSAAQLAEELLDPGPRRRRTPEEPVDALSDGGAEALASVPGVALPTIASMLRAPTPPDGPDQSDPAGLAPHQPGPGQPPPVVDHRDTDDEMRPMIGNWQITYEGANSLDASRPGLDTFADDGMSELLVVDERGKVTWTGADEAGPFVATGDALPLGDGTYRLLLNEPAGSAGFFVDLRLEGGGLSFVMDHGPDDGAVDVAAG